MNVTSFLYFTAPFLDPIALALVVLAGAGACGMYYRPMDERRRVLLYTRLLVGLIIVRIMFAGIKTVLQYYTWLQSDISRYLLPPHQSIAVLLRYSWTHFGLNALISIVAALFVFIVLRLLQMHNTRYFSPGEPVLGAVLALVVGWPGFLVFVPVTLISIVFVSIVRTIFLQESYTTFGPSMFFAAVVALLVGRSMLSFMGLTALFI